MESFGARLISSSLCGVLDTQTIPDKAPAYILQYDFLLWSAHFFSESGSSLSLDWDWGFVGFWLGWVRSTPRRGVV